MSKRRSALSIIALVTAAGAASAQITPIGPFSGSNHETFENIGLWPPDGPCVFCVSDPGAFGGICTIESVDGSASIHVTGGWGFVCNIGPNFTPRISAATGGGGYDYHFSGGSPVSQFGGYFGTNCGVADGTAQFYDGCGNLIGSAPITAPADCSWTWNGWSFSVPVYKVRIIGNFGGGGYLQMDDMEATTVSPGPTGACCIPSTLSCDQTTAAVCTCIGGVFHGLGSSCAAANCPSPGACCLTDGSCIQATPAACANNAGAIYRGDSTACASANCPQPPTGACCMEDGSCTVLTQAQCAAAIGGIYHGDNVTCANANCPQPLQFTMNCNAQGTFTDISATGTVIPTNSPDDGTGAFTSSVTNVLVSNPNLYACTNGFISNLSFLADYFNQPLPYGVSGLTLGLFPNWDDLYVDGAGVIVHQAVVQGGVNVEIIQWSNVRTYFQGPGGPTGSFEVKIFGPGGPALVQYLYQGMAWDWNGNSSTVGVQWGTTLAYTSSYNQDDSPPPPPGQIPDNSVCSITQLGGATCYANCDHSSTQPCLNVLDFGCFLNQFAAGATYANCDNSTTPPVLNVLDFGCFLNKFAAGCSSC